ncbi:MAG: NADPH-dependent glutamate synthase [Armatimonadota bacterium]
MSKPSMKERRAIPRQKMPEQDPAQRVKNFDEVPFGLSEEAARLEALRCLECKRPKCMDMCPVEVDIPGFIRCIQEGDYQEAIRIVKATNALPAICGRVCPQEEQCETTCVLGVKGEPVAVGRLERFVADWEREHGKVEVPQRRPPTGKRVAIVGSGPSGLTVAGDLALLGHEVIVLEALHELGGVLTYGIPEFRLPKAIVRAEVDYLRKLGVEYEPNFVVGKTATVDELLEEYDAVFIGIGAGAPWMTDLPGENLCGIYSANEYLTRANLMRAYDFPNYDTPIIRGRKIAVLGGGNTAMDAARTALRLSNGGEVSIVYRRSRREMPARDEEIHHGEEEGIQFHFLTNPTRFIGDQQGWVRAMECIRMELGEPDDSGRRRPIPIEGSEFIMDVDTVISAFGTNANPIIRESTPGLECNKWGYIVADPETGATSKPGVYAGGDIVTGAATVIEAMGAGKRSARAIHEYLTGEKLPGPREADDEDESESDQE